MEDKNNSSFSSEQESEDIGKLLSNADIAKDVCEKCEKPQENKSEEAKENGKKHVFEKFKIKDIVFLAIMSACMLLTGGVMPLLSKVPLFGIIQLGMGLQFSIFPVIGLMKTRKMGSLLFMSVFCGVVMVFMNPVMLVVIILCALIIEGLVALIFRGYSKDGACLLAGSLYMPLTLPPLMLYYRVLFTGDLGETGAAVNAMAGITNPWVAIGMSVAVVAVCVLGSIIGILISRELKKSGALKK